MDQKIIFLDIDGTLTEPGKNEPPDTALQAVKAARRKGNLVYLCSGRNYEMLSPLLKYEFDGVIASSGGYVTCGSKVIYDCPMTEEQKNRAITFLDKNKIFKTIECLDGSFTDEGFKDFLRNHAKAGKNSELLRWREQIEHSLNILPMREYKGQPIYKIVIMSETREQLEEPRKALEQDFMFCIQDEDKYGFVNGEIVNRKFDKGQGVKRVCEHLGIDLGKTAGFGDSMNDLEMMETVALSICMGNGSETLKRMADDICPSVSEDGLYQAFKKYNFM